MRNIKQKRITFKEKAWYILRPFLTYMVLKTFILFFLEILIPNLPIDGLESWVMDNSYMLKAVLNGVSSILAVGFVMRDFLNEVAIQGEVDIDKNVCLQFADYMKKGFMGYGKINIKGVAFSALLGAASAYVLNYAILFLLNLFDLVSDKYEAVHNIQYSVPFWMGIILYGIVSPAVEEIVFRGVLYNRIKRFYSTLWSVIFSALLFGIFHGNLPQCIYGTLMGALMAVCYERSKCFGAPVAFHMAANILAFTISYI